MVLPPEQIEQHANSFPGPHLELVRAAIAFPAQWDPKLGIHVT